MRPTDELPLVRITIRVDSLDEHRQPDGESIWVRGLGHVLARSDWDEPIVPWASVCRATTGFEVRWITDKDGWIYRYFTEEPT